MLNFIDLPRFDGFLTRLNHTRKVIWMDCADQCPVLQLFVFLSEILKGLSVEKFHFAHCAHRSHQPRNTIRYLAPGEFACPSRFLFPLTTFNIDAGSVPFNDFPRFVSQWVRAKQEPSIGSVEATHTRFSLNRLASNESQLPIFDKSLAIIWMNRLGPPPALSLFRSHARVIQPTLIEEVAVAIRTSSPCRCRNRVDNYARIALVQAQSLCSLLGIIHRRLRDSLQ